MRVVGIERERADDALSTRATLLARAVAERGRFVLGEASHAGKMIEAHWNASDPELQAELSAMLPALNLKRAQIEIRNAAGRVRARMPASSGDDAPGPALPPTDARTDRIWISDPARDARSGGWIVRVTHFVMRGGSMAGTVSLLIDPEEHACYFSLLCDTDLEPAGSCPLAEIEGQQPKLDALDGCTVVCGESQRDVLVYTSVTDLGRRTVVQLFSIEEIGRAHV